MVEIKIFVNHIDHTNKILLESGFTHKETITQELENKACVFLVKEEDKELIQVDDLIAIQRKVNNDFVDTDYFLVGAVESSLFTKQEPYYWKKTTILVELTKELERILLPPCSFTNPNDDLLTIFNKALDKAFVRRENQPSKFVLTGRLETLLRDQAGEDFIYNQPTILRNILDDILLVKNARIKVSRVLRLGVLELDYKPLSFENRPVKDIDLLKHSNIKDLKIIDSLNGKAREYETFAKGVYSTELPKQPYLLTWENWQTLKPVEIDIATTKNVMLTTSFPIEKIRWIDIFKSYKLKIYTLDGAIEKEETEEISLITRINDDIIKEEEIYNILSSSEQKKYIPYKKGSKAIGVCKRINGFIDGTLYFNFSTLDIYVKAKFDAYIEKRGLHKRMTGVGVPYPQYELEAVIGIPFYRIVYNAYLDQHYSFTKDEKNKGTILIAPSESLIDSKRYADKVYNTTQSQGNLRLECDFTFDNLDQDKNIYKDLKVGNKIRFNNKIFTITSKEKSFNKEHIKDHLVLDENYMPELPEKLSRERQLFKNPIDNIIERNVLLKDIITFNLNNSYTSNSFISCENIFELMKKSFVDNEMVLPIETALIKLEEGKPIINSTYYALQVAAQRVGKSILYNFGFLDNYSAGYSFGDHVVGGYKVDLNPYVDDNGELKEVYIELLTNKMSMALGNISVALDLTDTIAALPKISYSNIADLYNRPNIVNGKKILLQKDRLEHIIFTYQLEFLSTPEIVIGNKFLDCLRLIGGSLDGLKVYGDTENVYTDKDKIAKGNVVVGASVIALTENIALNNINMIQYNSVGIADKNGNLILGINNKKQDKKKIYIRIAARK